MKIYTRTGDLGETSLASGTRVPKDHPRLEAYGTVDELNSYLGLIQSMIPDTTEKLRITRIQKRIFVVCACLSIDNIDMLRNLPGIVEEDVTELEQAMDQIINQLPIHRNFILPAGNPVVAHCHIARTICRRAERRMVTLSREVFVDAMQIKFINRLSDYLFVLARKSAMDLGVTETEWTSDFRNYE